MFLNCFFLLIFFFVTTVAFHGCACKTAFPSHSNFLFPANGKGEVPHAVAIARNLAKCNNYISALGCPSFREADGSNSWPSTNFNSTIHDKNYDIKGDKRKEEGEVAAEHIEDSGVIGRQAAVKLNHNPSDPEEDKEETTIPIATKHQLAENKDLLLNSNRVSFFSAEDVFSVERNKILSELKSASSSNFLKTPSTETVKNPINGIASTSVNEITNDDENNNIKKEDLVEGQQVLWNVVNSLSGAMLQCHNPTFESVIGEEFTIDVRDMSDDPNVVRNVLFTAFLNQLPPAGGPPFIKIREIRTNNNIAGDVSVICASEGRFTLEFLVSVNFGWDYRVAAQLCSAQAVCSTNRTEIDPGNFRVFFSKSKFPCINRDCPLPTTTTTTTAAPGSSVVLNLNTNISEGNISFIDSVANTSFPNMIATNGDNNSNSVMENSFNMRNFTSNTLVPRNTTLPANLSNISNFPVEDFGNFVTTPNSGLQIANLGSPAPTATYFAIPTNLGNAAPATAYFAVPITSLANTTPVNSFLSPTTNSIIATPTANSFALPVNANFGSFPIISPYSASYVTSINTPNLGNTANFLNPPVLSRVANVGNFAASPLNFKDLMVSENLISSAQAPNTGSSTSVSLNNQEPSETRRSNSPIIRCQNSQFYGRIGDRIEYLIVPFELISAFGYNSSSTNAMRNTASKNIVAIISDVDSSVVKFKTQEITSTSEESSVLDRAAVATHRCLREGIVTKKYFISAVDESNNVITATCPVKLICSQNRLPVVVCKTSEGEPTLVRTALIGERISINLEGIDNDLFTVTDPDNSPNSLRYVLQSGDDKSIIFAFSAVCAAPYVKQLPIIVTPYDSENQGIAITCFVTIQCVTSLVGVS